MSVYEIPQGELGGLIASFGTNMTDKRKMNKRLGP